MTTPDLPPAELPHELRAALRAEIVEAQKLGADFLKWKLIGIAAVASVALGVAGSGKSRIDALLALCVIPLICAYTDIVNLDLVTRISVIAAYLRKRNDDYETFVSRLRSGPGNPFRLGLLTIYLSSMVSNLLLLVLGFFDVLSPGASSEFGDIRIAFMVAGLLGTVVTTLIWKVHAARMKYIARAAQEMDVS